MAARARVLAEPGVDALRSAAADGQRVGSTLNEKAAASLYGGALAAAKLRDFKLAAAQAAQLGNLMTKPGPSSASNNATKSGLTQAAAQLALEVELMAGTVPPGAAQFDISKAAQANQRADLLLQSRALLATGAGGASGPGGRAADVSSVLLGWVNARPKDAAAWLLLAQAYGQQGKKVRAIWADAEARVVQMDYTAALDRLKAAQSRMRSNPGSGDFMDGSIVDTRARQVESLVREQALQDKLDR